MQKRIPFLLMCLFLASSSFSQSRKVLSLQDWKFHKGDMKNAHKTDIDDSTWEKVTVPHDWAIYGPFDQEIDKQTVLIEQNNEKQATEKTGRTGALPFVGVGWYRTELDLPDDLKDKKLLLTFDGAMSNAQVFLNGELIGGRPYGYSYFYFDITDKIKANQKNVLAVRLENLPFSSRWYPGAGLYRKVQLIIKNDHSFEHWGNYVTTKLIGDTLARVHVRSKVSADNPSLTAHLMGADGKFVTGATSVKRYGDEMELDFAVYNPKLWSPEDPYLYTLKLELQENGRVIDEESMKLGIRSIRYSAEDGFELNGKKTKFKGVCLHHDLGPLGAAINKSALRRQLQILKDMGCNAVRSAHNMPSLEQLELCDEMGFLFLAESFDEWHKPKVKNGYNLYFDEWAEKDVMNLVHATRNYPCIVMWSAGNEVPDQWGSDGVKRLRWLQDIFHREDPTRPVTVGMDQVKAVMENGFAAILDVPGFNYRVHLYEEAYEKFPQGFILGSETASTVSSRGVYKFPVKSGFDMQYDDGQSSSYDLEYCSWSNIPEDDFWIQEQHDWVLGQFVWTGFDYLGEPTPYDEYWPSRSSYFGICDLAGLPKDRYYLYRSLWNENEETLHMLPHWNWKGREGDTIPVFVYTSYPAAELFVNGKSQGVRKKNPDSKMDAYRLKWMDVLYEPGVVKVVALDEAGNPKAEKEIRTAGKPHHLKLEADRETIFADGEDISFVTVNVVDKDGNLCPLADNELEFEVSGKASFRAVCNGDPTSLEMFHLPQMKAFNGKLVVLVQAAEEAGAAELKVKSKGLKSDRMKLQTIWK